MGWVSAASGLVSAGTSIIGGISERNRMANAAAWNDYYARKNAEWAIEAGEWNIQSIIETAVLNNELLMGVAEIESASVEQIAEFNATLRVMAGDYNAALIASEAFHVAEVAALDEFYVERATDDYVGSLRTMYGSSGVLMNQDTPEAAIIDARTQEFLETFVIRHNADVEIKRIFDNAAMSEWQGRAEAATILNDGYVKSGTNMVKAGLTSIGNLVSAKRSAETGLVNTMSQVREILTQGSWRSHQYRNEGDAAFMKGLFGAGTSLLNNYRAGSFESWGLSPSAKKVVTAEYKSNATILGGAPT